MIKTVNIRAITNDKLCQSRVEILDNVIEDYAELIRDGVEFPPVMVKFDGQNYFLWDGFHRYLAAQRAGKASIQCYVEDGTLRDAIFSSLAANSTHGVRRTIEDKRKSVITMLEDVEWSQMKDREIARHCAVSHTFATRIRKEFDATGGNVATKKKAPAKKSSEDKPNKKADDKPVDSDDHNDGDQHDPKQEVILELEERNAKLEQRLAVGLMEATPEEKQKASDLMDELREEIRLLRIENEALSVSRDTFQAENAQLKKQVKMLQKKLKEAGIE